MSEFCSGSKFDAVHPKYANYCFRILDEDEDEDDDNIYRTGEQLAKAIQEMILN